MDRLLEEIKRTPLEAWDYKIKDWLISEIESLRRQLAVSKEIQAAEKKILIAEIEKNTGLREQLAEVQLRREETVMANEYLTEQLAENSKTIQLFNEELSKNVLELEKKDATICGMREVLESIYLNTKVEAIAKALSSSPTCLHKEEAERLKADLADARATTKWAVEPRDKKIADLQAELASLQEDNVRLRGAIDEECGYHRINDELIAAKAELASLREAARAVIYMADEKNWDQEDGQYRFIRPGGFRQEGIIMVSRHVNPWLFAAQALSAHKSKWPVKKEG